MIQFNLLPSVKLEYVKAKRNKRMTIVTATLIGVVSFAIFVILFMVVQVFQKQHINALTKDIQSESKTLEDIADLNKILTIQNQLNSLTTLHDSKPVATRLFGYLKQVTPVKVSMATINVDFETSIISITGSADSSASVNVFVDTLKFTNYKIGDEDKGKAFSDVVLAGFGIDAKGTSYQISLVFDPAIFASQVEVNSPVTLSVPANKITTRSEIEKPGEKVEDLFQPLIKPKVEDQ